MTQQTVNPSSADTPPSLVWIRRDMRLHDHASLAAALEKSHPVQLVFVLDTEVLARFTNPDDRRLTFIAETLVEMHRELQHRGGGMLILHGPASEVIPALCETLHAPHLFAGADYEPATRERDRKVAEAVKGPCNFTRVKEHVIHAPYEVVKDDNTPYKVFTPFSKLWRTRLTEKDYAEIPVKDKGRYADFAAITSQLQSFQWPVLDAGKGAKALLEAIGYRLTNLGEWQPAQAGGRLELFVENRIKGYDDGRNFLAKPLTSKLSPYLRFGQLSVRECLRGAIHGRSYGSGKGAESWINELIWRDFYAMILFHYPESARDEWNPKYRGISWQGEEAHWQAFCEGKTGYPIVDAAIRQLLQTGWMHNRARMIVASFLTKHLRIDWRKGEEFFAQYLMDYELASNVGGWQWAASTGTDAQPYFRIFNPVAQGQKFDPEGEYIRRYVPELSSLPDSQIHEPWKSLMRPSSYPLPIVDHKEAREKALAMFKAAGE